MSDDNFRHLVRNFIIELLLYGALVAAYFLLVIKFLGEWLADLFQGNLTLYAILALVLVVVQGVFLDAVTTFFVNWLNLERLE